GNSGVLTLAAEPLITLRLHPLDGSPSRPLATHFKSQVATDPAGRWFAYLEYQDSPIQTLVFRRPSGRVIRRRQLARIFPQLVAAVSADRRTAPPAGDYSSPWARQARRTALAVNRNEQRHDQDRDDGGDLDHRVDRGAGGVLV